MVGATPFVVNGWTVFAHPLFLDQLDALLDEVETARVKNPVRVFSTGRSVIVGGSWMRGGV